MLIKNMYKSNKSYPILHGKVGGYWFEFANGNLSKVFYNARNFVAGFAAVQEFNNSEWRFLNLRNALSRDSYVTVNNYDDHNGFAHVILSKDKAIEGETNFQRDYIGRLSNGLTSSGQAFYLYITGQLDWKNMKMKYFDDEKFMQAVKKEEMRRYLAKNPKATREEKQDFLALLDEKIATLCREELNNKK